jgi:hypothetical protein
MTTIILPKIDILSAFTSEPQQRDYVLPSFPIGKVGLLAGAGGTGKSFLVIVRYQSQSTAKRISDRRKKTAFAAHVF